MMLPRFALTLSIAVQVLLVCHSSIASFPVVVGATTTTSSNNKEDENTTATSVLRLRRGGLKKSSQEVASTTAFGANGDEKHHILKNKEAPKVVLSNAADQTMHEDVVLGNNNNYSRPSSKNINMIHEYDNRDIREDFEADKNFASELPDMTLPTRNAGMTTRKLSLNRVVAYNGDWGDWGPTYYFPSGNLAACGAELRMESPNNYYYDKTAANGIRFKFCGLHGGRSWNYQGMAEPATGVRGDWKGMKMCPKYRYIGALNVKYQDRIRGDNTALNGLRIWCVDKNWGNGSLIEVDGGSFGSYKGWKYIPGKLVKEVQARSEKNNGSEYTSWGSENGDGDDTGLNGIAVMVGK